VLAVQRAVDKDRARGAVAFCQCQSIESQCPPESGSPIFHSALPKKRISESRRLPYARPMGTLYYGDNLDILRRYLKDETVDLVYLDPPFNSAQNYNAFFHEKDGTDAASQIPAFEDTWSPNRNRLNPKRLPR
jgi:hypothetical protein